MTEKVNTPEQTEKTNTPGQTSSENDDRTRDAIEALYKAEAVTGEADKKRLSVNLSHIRLQAGDILTGFFVTLSIILAVDISTRFFSGGPDIWGLVLTAAQAFLALLAGSTFTEAGRQWIDAIFLHVRKGKYNRRFRFVLATIILSFTVLFRIYGLPKLAMFYNKTCADYLQGKLITDAVYSCRRATSLNPDYTEAHYNLANAYEGLTEYDKAMAEYQRSIEIDRNFMPGYNNLARLYMLQHEDYSRALELTDVIVNRELKDDKINYAAHKNRGWAFLGLGNLKQAERDLRDALKFEDGAEAHFILAEVLEKLGKKNEAQEECYRGTEAVKPGDGTAPRWLALCVERLER
jgi:tetratricopeptide (TPR) repeat protein